MKKIIFLLFFLISNLILYSKDINLLVIDKEIGIPLEGVKVTIKNTNQTGFSGPDGKLKFIIPDNEERIIVSAILIGYEQLNKLFKEIDDTITLEMNIQGILEGQELVIEEESIGKTDEELGVSIVVDKEILEATSESGIIEDVLSSIKVMPGVSFTGSFERDISVRGGYPDELTVVYDGFYVRYPYIWGGAFSIFDPNSIESVKFSTGIFNVRYGYAASGLIEMQGVQPDDGLKIKTKFSPASVLLMLQTPLWSDKTGLLISARIQYWEFLGNLNNYAQRNGASPQTGILMEPLPYIRSVFLKWFWKPDDRFEWYISSLFNADGAGFKYDEELAPSSSADIVTNFTFNYYNYYFMGFTGFKILPHDRVFINFLVGYEYLLQGVSAESSEDGEKNYSSEFKDYYEQNFGPLTNRSFKIENMESYFTREQNLHSVQSRLDFDFTLHDRVILTTGTGFFFDYTYNAGNGESYSINWDNSIPTYEKSDFDIEREDKKIIKSFIFLGFNFNVVPETFKIDLGCRLDHDVIFGENNYSLNTIPVPGPRVNFTVTPVKNLKWLDQMSISAGVGLFSKVPLQETFLTEDLGINDFDIPIPKVLSTVLGFELDFPLGFKFKIEGYYKYYFHRMYINTYVSGGENKFYINVDGIGHVAGFDILFQRKLSRYIDGMISYSFIYARYLNPNTNGLDNAQINGSNPRGTWYYPSFHRFHTLNLILNIRPTSYMTITPKLSFASGKPMLDYEDPVPAGAYYDGEVIEIWASEENYSEILRSQISIPFDLKISYHFFIPKTPVYMEIYLGVKNLFAFIYTPRGSIETDPYTGETQPSPEAGVSLGIPEPSFGLEINF